MSEKQYNELERRILDQLAVIGVMIGIKDWNSTNLLLSELHCNLVRGKETIDSNVYELGCEGYKKGIAKLYGEE